MLSFEAFTDARVLHEHFGTPREGTALHAALEARARPVGALYANGAHTITSFNLIASLGEEAFDRALEAVPRNRLVLFAGSRRSPLFQLLRSNGYRVVTGYRSAYFAKEAGPGVDGHLAVWERSVCGLMKFRHRKLAFWGYCAAGDGRLWYGPPDEEVPHEHLMEFIEGVAPDSKQFTWVHFAFPDHVPEGRYDHRDASDRRDFKLWYVERSQRASRWLERLLDHIGFHDPEAIVLVFGDHGVRASYNYAWRSDREFVLRDRFSVAGGIFPPVACREEIDEAQVPGWLTHLDLIHAVLRCLSGGEDVRRAVTRYRPRLFADDARFLWEKYEEVAQDAHGPMYEDFVRPWSNDDR